MTVRQELQALTKCEIKAPTTDNLNKLGITDPNAPTEIENRVRKLQALLNQMTVSVSPGRNLTIQEITETNTRNMIRAAEAVTTEVLKPRNGRNFADMLARDFGIVTEWLGVGDRYTEAGWVRTSLQRIQRLYKGGAIQAFRRYGFQAKTEALYRDLVRMLKKRGIRQDEIDYITYNALELGYFPHLRNTQYVNQNAMQLMDKKYNNFLNELGSRFHLSKQEADFVMKQGASAAALNHQIASLVRDMGIELGETPMWGYIHRATSTEAKMRFNWKYEDDNLNKIRWNDNSLESPAEVFLRSRNTNQFVVEDEVLLDLVIRTLGDAHGDPLYYYRKAGVESIADVLDTNYGLSSLLGNILESEHPYVMEALLDNHLLSKVPYTTTEVFDYIRGTLKFPFEGIREVFAADWGTAMGLYRKALEDEAAKSGFISMMVQRVHDGAWGVSTVTAASNPELYKGWVPLRQALDEGILSRNYQRHSTATLDNFLVHPVVARQAKAMQEIMMSPYNLGNIARVISHFNRIWRSMVLSTVEYIPRQIWQTFISTGAAGGDLLALTSNLLKLGGATVSRNHFVNMLDNSRKLYKLRNGRLLTQRELYNHLEEIGLIEQAFDPATTVPLTKRYSGSGGMNWFKKHLRYLADTMSKEGILRTLEEGSANLADLSSPIMNAIMHTNVIMNNVGAFSAAESLLRQETASGPSHFLRTVRSIPTGGVSKFETVEDVVDHLRHYFYQYDDVTWYDRQFRTFAIPFYGFLSKNVPAIVRYMVRHPSRFLAHQRMYQLMNYPVQDDEWLNEGSVDQWSMDANPIYWKVEGGRPDGRDAYFVLPMEPIDPVMSGVNFIGEPIQGLLNHMGIFRDSTVRTTGERLKDFPWAQTQSNRMWNEMLERVYPLYQSAVATFKGEDLFGRNIDQENEFLGFRVSNGTRMWLETMLPILATINRYNPGGFRGTPDRYNIDTGTWELGEPGWLGNRMSGQDTFNQNNPYAGLQYLGIKVYPVDVYLNSGRTVDQLRISITEGRKYVQRLHEQAALQSNTTEAQKLEARANAYQYAIDQTTEDLLRFERFMRENGIDNPRTAYERLRVRNVRIGDLPNGVPEQR